MHRGRAARPPVGAVGVVLGRCRRGSRWEGGVWLLARETGASCHQPSLPRAGLEVGGWAALSPLRQLGQRPARPQGCYHRGQRLLPGPAGAPGLGLEETLWVTWKRDLGSELYRARASHCGLGQVEVPRAPGLISCARLWPAAQMWNLNIHFCFWPLSVPLSYAVLPLASETLVLTHSQMVSSVPSALGGSDFSQSLFTPWKVLSQYALGLPVCGSSRAASQSLHSHLRCFSQSDAPAFLGAICTLVFICALKFCWGKISLGSW